MSFDFAQDEGSSGEIWQTRLILSVVEGSWARSQLPAYSFTRFQHEVN